MRAEDFKHFERFGNRKFPGEFAVSHFLESGECGEERIIVFAFLLQIARDLNGFVADPGGNEGESFTGRAGEGIFRYRVHERSDMVRAGTEGFETEGDPRVARLLLKVLGVPEKVGHDGSAL